MELTEMERENMIWALIESELKWLLDNPHKQNVRDLADFFAKGGLSKYSDADLQKVYDMKFKEE